ncbi:unnamed protein product [Prunus brigantina]
MNGFFLQSTTTPRKPYKGIESALVFIGRVLESHSRLKKDLPESLKISAWWSLIGASK